MNFEQLNNTLSFNSGQLYMEHDNKLVVVTSNIHIIEEANFDCVDVNPETQLYQTTPGFSGSLQIPDEIISQFKQDINMSIGQKCDVYYPKQIRRHRKKRINKKWNKKYGIKTIPVKINTYTVESCEPSKNGNAEIILILKP